MEIFFKYFTPVTYWLLVIIWFYIFIFYTKKIKHNWKQDKLLGLLLVVLSIDAFRTLFESMYFGAWYTSLSGLIPIKVFDFLAQPQIVFFPKIINLITAFLILIILINKWLPLEINQKDKIEELLKKQSSELLKKNEELIASTKALRESEERFNLAMSASKDGLFDWNLVTNEIYYSPVWKSMLGYKDNELANDFSVWENLIEPEDAKASWEMQQELISKKRDRFELEFKMKHKSGDWVDILSRAEAVFDDEGKAIRIVGTHIDITKNKKVKEVLYKSEEKFKKLFQSTVLPLCYVDKDEVITIRNEKFIELFGYTYSDVPTLKEWWLKAYPDETYRAWVIENWEALVADAINAGGEIKSDEYNVTCKDGTVRNIVISGSIIEDNFLATFIDLTERKQAEEKLKQSEIKFRNAVTYAPYPIMIHSNGKVLQLSEEWVKQTGYTLEDIPTIKEWSLKAYGEDAIPSSEFIEKLYEIDKAQHDGEWKVRIKNGEYRFWDFSTSPIGLLATGEKMVISMASDTTKRKQAELALETEKERLAVTLSSIGDGVITTDTEGKIVMLNKVAERLTAWTSSEAFGLSLPEVFNIVNESTREKCQNPVERVLTTGLVELENQSCLIAKDAKEIIITNSGAPIHDKNSQIIGVVLVFRDMTEKQKLEESMQRADKLESLGVLAGGIAHDFNNLLSGIFGYTEMAIAQTTEEKVSNYLLESLSNIERARALTQQLLTFAKGGIPIKKTEKLFPFIKETVLFALSGSSVSCRFEIEKSLWVSDIDKNQIGQVVDNIIINAQQAMPNGGTIEVSAKNIFLADDESIALSRGKYIKLSIKDQGIGIPKEFLSRIFDPYYTTKPKGHGLGLATCYSIINRHNGIIDVESEPGKGSIFHIYLPASPKSVSRKIKKTRGRHRGSGRFLVMDDDKIIQKLMKEMLEGFGYTVVLKDNGKDTIDFFKAELEANRSFVGMIFDLTIPGGMGGKETIKEIRNISSDITVFVFSGYSADPIIANPNKYGFDASISKPFILSELSEMFEKHLK